MFSRKTKADATVDTFASTAHEAVDSAASFLDEAIDRLSPKVKDVADKATGLVQQVPTITEHAASQAKDRASGSARELIIPAALAAKEQVTPLVSTAREVVAPRVQTLVEAAQPHLETARTRVQSDLLPQLNDRLQQVADEHPAVADYSVRGQAALSALRGETTKYVPVEIDDPRSSKLKTFATVVGCGAVLAAIAVAVRKFLGSKDDGWTAHKPSSAYTDTKPADTKPAEPVHTTTTPVPADEKPADTKPADEQAAAPLVATTVKDAEEVMVDEGGPVAVTDTAAPADEAPVVETDSKDADAKDTEAKDADTDTDTTDADEPVDAELANAEPQYGEGWYMGDNPPSDYLIKGNERSMKYHVPGAGGYDRTIADVWFSSEDAAQKAGFTRAQR